MYEWRWRRGGRVDVHMYMLTRGWVSDGKLRFQQTRKRVAGFGRGQERRDVYGDRPGQTKGDERRRYDTGGWEDDTGKDVHDEERVAGCV